MDEYIYSIMSTKPILAGMLIGLGWGLAFFVPMCSIALLFRWVRGMVPDRPD